jgi:large subunit ribosomal protein L4
VVGATGDKVGSVELPAEIFDVTVNVPLVHQVVVAQLAAARQGTHSTKTRGEARGGGRKPYRQKGTGRARQGSLRAPQFTGGGTVHGPTPRSYEQRTPKKMKAAALRGALSDRARDGRVHVVSGFVEGDEPSTRAALETLGTVLGGEVQGDHSAGTAAAEWRNVLVVLDRDDMTSWKSLRNIPEVHLLVPDQLNAYDVLVSDDVVFTTTALDRFLAGVESPGRRPPGTPAVKSPGGRPAGTPTAESTGERRSEDPARRAGRSTKAIAGESGSEDGEVAG